MNTAFFTGNFTPQISIQGANIRDYESDAHDEWMPGSFDRFERGGGIRGSKVSPELIAAAEQACSESCVNGTEWYTLVPMVALQPGYPETRMHYFAVDVAMRNKPITHIRINYFPDGGVARLKAFGTVNVDFDRLFFHAEGG